MEEKYLEGLSEGSLKDLYKAFNVRNVLALEKKIKDKNIILSKMFSLTQEEQSLILFMIQFMFNKKPFAIDIAYRMNYQQKELPFFFGMLDRIKEKGFIYYQKKRMRLNASDDIIFFVPEIKFVIENYIIKKESDINEENIELIDEKFVSKVFTQYEEFIVYLHNLGGVIEYNKEKFENLGMNVDGMLELISANVVSTYFLADVERNVYSSRLFVCLDNIRVLDTIKNNIYKKMDNTTFVYNHFNILSDIDTLINKTELENLKLENGNSDVKMLTDNLSLNEVCNICVKANLVTVDFKSNISLNNENINTFLEYNALERIDILSETIFFERKELYSIINSTLNHNNGKDVFINDILKEIKQKGSNCNFDLLSKMLYSMFILGLIEVAFYEKSIIAVKKRIKPKQAGRCIINGNYELTLIDHKYFDSEFIYMASIYFELEKQDNVYSYSITEDSILRGKAIETENSKYSFDTMLNVLEKILNKNGLAIPKHIETSIRRWYDRVVKMSLFENVTIIKLDGVDKLDEVIYDAKKKDITINPISSNYAIIETNKSKKALIKFFRQKKIIISL